MDLSCVSRFALALAAGALLLAPLRALGEDDAACKNHFILRCEWSAIEWVSIAQPLVMHGEGLTATTLADGRVLVAGGSEQGRAAEIYDPQADAWSRVAPMVIPRAMHVAVLLADGRVLVVGGDYWGIGTFWKGAASAEIFDPAAGSWTAAAPLLVQRFVWARDLTATRLQDGRVLVVGGNTARYDGIADAETFDPATGAWQYAGNLRQGRVGHTASLLADGRVMVAGGVTDWDFWFTAGGSEIYDPASGAWTAPGSGPHASNHATTTLADGRLLVAGGQGDVPSAIGPPGSVWPLGTLSASYLYDPVTALWSATGALVAPRSGHLAIATADGNAIAVGGAFRDLPYLGGYTVSATMLAERYDAGSGTWSEIEQSGAPPQEPQAAATLAGRGVLVVGYDGAALLRTTPSAGSTD